VIGFDLPGCFAEIAILPEIALVKVDDRISDSEAACLQSLSDSVAAVETAQLRMADTVVILGQGSMGLECLQIARLSGAGLVITVDVRDEACQISRQLGADHALNARNCDVVSAIRDLTGGNGADIVFECAGAARSKGWRAIRPCPGARWRCGRAERSSACRGSAGPFRSTSILFRERSVALPVSGYQHANPPRAHGAPGRIGPRPAEGDDHARSVRIESVPNAFEITANKGSTRRSTRPKS